MSRKSPSKKAYKRYQTIRSSYHVVLIILEDINVKMKKQLKQEKHRGEQEIGKCNNNGNMMSNFY